MASLHSQQRLPPSLQPGALKLKTIPAGPAGVPLLPPQPGLGLDPALWAPIPLSALLWHPSGTWRPKSLRTRQPGPPCRPGDPQARSGCVLCLRLCFPTPGGCPSASHSGTPAWWWHGVSTVKLLVLLSLAARALWQSRHKDSP